MIINHRMLTLGAVMSGIFAVMSATAQEATQDAGSEIYRWTDENGTVHFGERAPQGAEAQAVDIAPPPSAGVGGAEPAAPDPLATGDDEDLSPGAQARAERQARAEEAAESASIREQLSAACTSTREQSITLESSTNVLVDDGAGGTRRLDDDERLRMLAEARDFLAKNCD